MHHNPIYLRPKGPLYQHVSHPFIHSYQTLLRKTPNPHPSIPAPAPPPLSPSLSTPPLPPSSHPPGTPPHLHRASDRALELQMRYAGPVPEPHHLHAVDAAIFPV